jgi:hypothetical protein
VPRDTDVRLEPLAGCLSETVLLVRGSGRTLLVFSRVLVNRPPHGLWEKLLRAGAPPEGPQFNRRFRWRDVNDRKALHDHLSDLAGIDNLARVVTGEGAEIAGAEARAVLQRLAESV